uniref:Lol14.2b n=1 Tax=Bichromomyia olmeca TaxID=715919 RepID=A0A1B1V3F3_9DIPT|nr:Lol14.2b [Bichromomyia olmeca]
MKRLWFFICVITVVLLKIKSSAAIDLHLQIMPKDPNDCVINENYLLFLDTPCDSDTTNTPVKNGKKIYIVCTNSEGDSFKFYECFEASLLGSNALTVNKVMELYRKRNEEVRV